MAGEVEKGEDKDKKPYVPEFDIVEEDTDKPEKKEEKSAYADERLSADQRTDDDDDDHGTDVTTDTGEETDEQIQRKREKRRAERKAQKARQNLARERDKRELNLLRISHEQLNRKVAELETKGGQRQAQTELAVVEGRIQQLEATQAEIDEALAAATVAGNQADIAKLNKAQRQLTDGLGRLNTHKDSLKRAAVPGKEGGEEEEVERRDERRGAEEGGEVQIPPGAVRNLQVFAKRHPWVKPQGGDQDSRIVRALDTAVMEEGFDPTTSAYWEELEDRMKEVLPHRFKKGAKPDPDDDDDLDEDDPAPARNGNGRGKPNGGKGPRMPGASQNRGGNGNRFFLTAERKAAMVEAGVWDDPVARDRQIRQYQQWDRDNADLMKGRQ